MKITEQSLFSVNQLSSKKQQDKLDFEQLIATPTKQSNGDEYYWQHQYQLEQSDIRFNPKPLEYINRSYKLTKDSLVKPSMVTDAVTDVAPIPVSPSQTYFNFPLETKDIPPQPAEELNMVINHLKKEVLFPYNETTTSCKNVPKIQTKEAYSPVLKSNEYCFKNHHLFIQGDQAELTFNTKDLDHQEQRELTQLIRLQLKNKGLILNKLIINGVDYD